MKKADIFRCQGKTILCLSLDFQMFFGAFAILSNYIPYDLRCQIFDFMTLKEQMGPSMVRYDIPD